MADGLKPTDSDGAGVLRRPGKARPFRRLREAGQRLSQERFGSWPEFGDSGFVQFIAGVRMHDGGRQKGAVEVSVDRRSCRKVSDLALDLGIALAMAKSGSERSWRSRFEGYGEIDCER